MPVNNEEMLVPLTGRIGLITEVDDPVFAQEMLGAGLCIDPLDGQLYAPVTGCVIHLAPTKHSITLRSEAGLEIMLHIGVDTVCMKGVGFDTAVEVNQQVHAGDLLIRFDPAQVARQAKSNSLIMVLLNKPDWQWHTTNSLPCDCAALQKNLISVGDENLDAASLSAMQTDAAMTEQQHSVTALALLSGSNGLHARPAAIVQRVAQSFISEISIGYNGKTASARSSLEIMSLNAPDQAKLQVSASGKDAQTALDTMVRCLESLGSSQPRLDLSTLLIQKIRVASQAPEMPLNTQQLRGTMASGGMAAGRAISITYEWPKVNTPFSSVYLELERLQHGIEKVRLELLKQKDKVQNSTEMNDILHAHLSLLEDPSWLYDMVRSVETNQTATQAVITATQKAMDTLQNNPNPILQERSSDLKDLGLQIVRELSPQLHVEVSTIPKSSVVVCLDAMPSLLLSKDAGNIMAILCARGSINSHIAIVARSLAIPLLVGMGAAVLSLKDKEELIVAADEGYILRQPSQHLYAKTLKDAETHRIHASRAASSAHLSSQTLDEQTILVQANIAHPKQAALAKQYGADGIGLCRTELLFTDYTQMPSATEQQALYQDILNQIESKIVTLRTFDIGGDKPLPFVDTDDSDNPAMGLRGLRLSLQQPQLLEQQLKAMFSLNPQSQLRILLPMVTEPTEVLSVRKRMAWIAQTLGLHNLPQLGIMLETPSSILMCQQFAPHVDFFSLGSNDLSQFVLAMDRSHGELAHRIDALHPAVLKLMHMACQIAAMHDLPIGLCGSIAEDTEALAILMGIGIRDFSINPLLIPKSKDLIRSLTLKDCQDLAAHCMESSNALDVREKLKDFIHAKHSRAKTPISRPAPIPAPAPAPASDYLGRRESLDETAPYELAEPENANHYH